MVILMKHVPIDLILARFDDYFDGTSSRRAFDRGRASRVHFCDRCAPRQNRELYFGTAARSTET